MDSEEVIEGLVMVGVIEFLRARCFGGLLKDQ